MYVAKNNNRNYSKDLSLREMLSLFLKENEITDTAISDEVGITRATLSKFLRGESDLKFMQAIRLMKILGLSEGEFIAVYCKDKEIEDQSLERLERISYIAKNFDVAALKKLNIITPRAKVDEYETCICNFLGIKSIYEYDDTSLMPILFSKSNRQVQEEKESKMTAFWLRCAIRSFYIIGNPNEFDKEMLLQLLRRASEFTEDEKRGYYRFVLVLYQIGVTVLTQAYTTGTKAHGGTMILDGKPYIVVTDMGKKYHKLWISLLHELYHVVNDFEMIETLSYHYSTPETPDLFLNEQKADLFALNILINPTIQDKLIKVIPSPFKVKALAKELHVSPSIIYGVYLESLPSGKLKNKQSAQYNKENFLISSEEATKGIIFDPVSKRSLITAIEELKTVLTRKVIG